MAAAAAKAARAAEAEPRRGPVWGLEDPEARRGEQAVGTEVRLPSELRGLATFWLFWPPGSGQGVSGVS